jgi:transposase-like protein
MTEENITLTELLQKSGESDFLRTVAEAVLQILMEADVEGLIGAGRHERSAERLGVEPIARHCRQRRNFENRQCQLHGSSPRWWRARAAGSDCC